MAAMRLTIRGRQDTRAADRRGGTGAVSKTDDILGKMRQNPAGDWRIEDLLTVAGRIGLDVRGPKGSHFHFTSPALARIQTVPAHRPIKAHYIRHFVAFACAHLDAAKGEKDG